MAANHILVLIGLAATLAALGGCAGDPQTAPSTAHMFGLISGPVPEPKPFVKQARHPVPDTYPAVGLTPPTRQDKILTVPERSKLEAELKSYSKPTAAAAATKPAPKRKKPIPKTPGPATPAPPG